MSRYIDAEQFRGKHEVAEVNGKLSSVILYADIVYAPTADVVPKSEVDRLVDKWIGEENLTQDEKTLRLIETLRDEAKRYERYYFNHEYDKLIAEAKADVAREIFEEIEEKIIIKHLNDAIKSKSVTAELHIDYIELDIAELKKKYTEGESNGN